MGLCGLSGGRKLQTTLQTGILIVCCTVMFFCSCCLVFSVSGECGEVLLLLRYHQLLNIVKLAGLIVWSGFITIIWSVCFIRMGWVFCLFFALLLNVSGIFFRRALLHERCVKKRWCAPFCSLLALLWLAQFC